MIQLNAWWTPPSECSQEPQCFYILNYIHLTSLLSLPFFLKSSTWWYQQLVMHAKNWMFFYFFFLSLWHPSKMKLCWFYLLTTLKSVPLVTSTFTTLIIFIWTSAVLPTPDLPSCSSKSTFPKDVNHLTQNPTSTLALTYSQHNHTGVGRRIPPGSSQKLAVLIWHSMLLYHKAWRRLVHWAELRRKDSKPGKS